MAVEELLNIRPLSLNDPPSVSHHILPEDPELHLLCQNCLDWAESVIEEFVQANPDKRPEVECSDQEPGANCTICDNPFTAGSLQEDASDPENETKGSKSGDYDSLRASTGQDPPQQQLPLDAAGSSSQKAEVSAGKSNTKPDKQETRADVGRETGGPSSYGRLAQVGPGRGGGGGDDPGKRPPGGKPTMPIAGFLLPKRLREALQRVQQAKMATKAAEDRLAAVINRTQKAVEELQSAVEGARVAKSAAVNRNGRLEADAKVKRKRQEIDKLDKEEADAQKAVSLAMEEETAAEEAVSKLTKP